MKKETPIRELTIGATITDVFLLCNATKGQARNGPYWKLELRDAYGSISAKVWSPLSLEYSIMPTGKFLRITARVGNYKEKAELSVSLIEELSEEEISLLSMADFIPASPYNPTDMLTSLKELCIKECSYPPWKDFIFSLLEDEDIAKRLLLSPAAKSMHHAYAGGLLEHMLSVSQLCMLLANQYPVLDRQLLLVGAICHDLGKVWELTSGLIVDYTDEGRLIGHISLAVEKIQPFLIASNLDHHLVIHLKHLILSHHGTLEFGSPKVPATAEAFILHYADNIDAKMQQMSNALSLLSEESGWSGYIPALERFLYKAQPTPLQGGQATFLERSLEGTQGIGDTLYGEEECLKEYHAEGYSEDQTRDEQLQASSILSGQDIEGYFEQDSQRCDTIPYEDIPCLSTDSEVTGNSCIESNKGSFFEEVTAKTSSSRPFKQRVSQKSQPHKQVYVATEHFQPQEGQIDEEPSCDNSSIGSIGSLKNELEQQEVVHNNDTTELGRNQEGGTSKGTDTKISDHPLNGVLIANSSQKSLEREKATHDKSTPQVLSLLDHCS